MSEKLCRMCVNSQQGRVWFYCDVISHDVDAEDPACDEYEEYEETTPGDDNA